MAEKSDCDIINLVLSGDTDSFAVLINRHKDRVFKMVSAHIPPECVEETANDIFFKAYKSLANFKSGSPFINWLSVIAVNTCRDFWRAGYANKEAPLASFDEETEESLKNRRSSGKTPEEELLENERKKMLYNAMNVLKPNERIIINMLYTEERSVAETAEFARMTEANVKVIAFRARKKLADALNAMTGGVL